jgi:hypothetical protein
MSTGFIFIYLGKTDKSSATVTQIRLGVKARYGVSLHAREIAKTLKKCPAYAVEVEPGRWALTPEGRRAALTILAQ